MLTRHPGHTPRNSITPRPMSILPPRPLRIAHRGIPAAARENTIASFALAVEAGADGIELDVHVSLDGVICVHHDPDLPDGGAIADLTWRDVSARAPWMPTLGAVCDLVAGRCELFVELKGAGVETIVADELDRYAGAAAIHSFDHAAIRRLHASGSRLRLGILLEHAVADVDLLMAETGAMDVWPHASLATAPLIEAVHRHDGRVLVWTVNDPRDARELIRLGVDGVCSDDVRTLPIA